MLTPNTVKKTRTAPKEVARHITIAGIGDFQERNIDELEVGKSGHNDAPRPSFRCYDYLVSMIDLLLDDGNAPCCMT